MKTFLIAAAAVCGVALAAPASAQMNDHSRTTVVERTTTGDGMRHDMRTMHETRKTVTHSNRWWHRGWTKRKVCRTVWRHHHRVRRCTWQNFRR